MRNSKILGGLLLLLLELLCVKKLYQLVWQFVGSHLYWLESQWWNDLLVLLIGGLAATLLVKGRRARGNEVFSNYKRDVFAAFVAVLYIYARFWHCEVFLPFSLWQLLAYLDVAFALFLLWFFLPCFGKEDKGAKKEKTDNQPKMSESSKNNETMPVLAKESLCPEDELGRKEEAKVVCDYLTDQQTDYSTAVAVAITGSWGSGKSTFMNYMKERLDAVGVSYFDYSPWQRSDNDLTLDFLNTLDNHLEKHDRDVNNLRRYIRSLKVTNVTGWFGLVLQSLRHLFSLDGGNTKDMMDQTAADMSLMKRPVVAFIDDVDRVSGDDFLDVMRIIRATANFPNLIYVVSYDKERAVKLLGPERGDKFLEKIFNVTHELIRVDDDTMQKLAKKRFGVFGVKKEDDSPFVSLMSITDCLPTIRDLNRYFNLLGKEMRRQKALFDETYLTMDFYAKFVLLRHIDPVVWKLLETNPKKYLIAEDENWDNLWAYRVNQKVEFDNDATKELMVALFDSETGFDCAFVCPSMFQLLYKTELDKDSLTKTEFEAALKSDSFLEMVATWIDAGMKELPYYLGSLYEDIAFLDLVKICEIIVEKKGCTVNGTEEIFASLMDTEVSPLYTFQDIRKRMNPYMYVEKHHELYLYISTRLTAILDGFDVLSDYARQTSHPRELLAIVYGLLMQIVKHDEIPEKPYYNLAFILFNRLAEMKPIDKLENQYKVAEALEYIPLYQSQYQLFKPLLKNNLENWLRLTLRQDDSIADAGLLVVNAEVMHTLFDTYNYYKEMMDGLMSEFADHDDRKALIDEHRKLVDKTKQINTVPYADFSENNYPHLKAIACNDTTPIPVLHYNYESTKELHKNGDVMFYNNKSRQPELFG